MFEIKGFDAAASLREFVADLDARAKRAIRESADAARAAAVATAPRRIGRTLRIRQDSGYRLRLDSTSKAAGLMEFGTRPHRIAPHKGKVLAFRVNGTMVFSRGVRHPGTKPYGFMRKGADAAERRLNVFASGSLV